MSILSDLNKILDIKEDIHSAIKEKGVNIDNDTPLDEYPTEIGKITGGGVALDSTTLVVRNLSGKDLKVGDSCWLNYSMYTSTDGETWNEDYVINRNDPITNTVPPTLGTADSPSTLTMNGEIYLDGCWLKQNGEIIWSGLGEEGIWTKK